MQAESQTYIDTVVRASRTPVLQGLILVLVPRPAHLSSAEIETDPFHCSRSLSNSPHHCFFVYSSLQKEPLFRWVCQPPFIFSFIDKTLEDTIFSLGRREDPRAFQYHSWLLETERKKRLPSGHPRLGITILGDTTESLVNLLHGAGHLTEFSTLSLTTNQNIHFDFHC